MASSATINGTSLDFVRSTSSNNVDVDEDIIDEDVDQIASSADDDDQTAGGHPAGLYDDGDLLQPEEEEEDEATVGSSDVIGGHSATTMATTASRDGLKRPSSQSPPTTTQDSVSGISMASQERSSTTSASCKKRRKQSNPVRLTANTTRVCDAAAAAGIVEVFATASAEDNDDLDNADASGVVIESSPSDVDAKDKQDLSSSDNDHDNDQHDDQCDDLELHQQLVYRCLHCGILFESEDHLRDHVEDEHVQRALEQQLHQHQQQNQNNLFSSVQSRYEPSFTQLPRIDVPSAASAPSSSSSSSMTSTTAAGATLTAQDVKPDLDQLNCALQQHQQQQLAMAALQSSKDVANLMALSAFGAAPFLIPIVPSSPIGATAGTPSAPANCNSSGGGLLSASNIGAPAPPPPIRIFNPEAFCEHCNKEFCNKYFLKIHKANKHGIYSLEVLAGAAAAASASASTSASALASTSAGVASSMPQSSVLSAPTAAPTSRASGGHVTSSSSSSFPCLPQMRPLLHASPPILGPENGGVISSTCSASVAATNLMLATSMANSLANGGSLIITPSMLGKALPTVMNPDAFCDICQKEFCNKYFLRKHRYKIHGIQEPHSTSSISANFSQQHQMSMMASSSASNQNQGHFDCVIATTLAAAAAAAAVAASVPSDMATSAAHHHHQHVTTSSHHHHHIPLPNNDLCFELGARDLSAKIAAAAALMQATPSLQTPPPKHSIQQIVASTSTSTSPTSVSGCPQLQQQQPSSSSGTELTAAATSKSSSAPVTSSMIFPPGSVTVAGHVFSPDRLREMGVINLDAFCEICCKEFCNKYFLRTHKANKHGIGTCSAGDMSAIMMGGGGGGGGFSPDNMAAIMKGSSHKYQSVPLSLVMDNKDGGGCMTMFGSGQDGGGGRKSATPNSNSSSSSTSSSSNSSGSGCLAHQSVNGHHQQSHLQQSMTSSLVMQSQLSRDAIGLSPELNCDMCNRPFSSLYLLKMHMFYFHNLGDISAMVMQQQQQTSSDVMADIKLESSDSPPATLPLKTMLLTSSASPSPNSSSNNPTSGSERGGSADIVAAKKSSTPLLAAGSTTPPVAATSQNQPQAPLSEDLQKLQTMISELNTSPLMAAKDSAAGAVKCNICFKDMKNKYFLRAHVMNEHGELHDEDMDIAAAASALDLGIVKREPNCDREGVIMTPPTPAPILQTASAIVTSADSSGNQHQPSATPPPPQLSPAPAAAIKTPSSSSVVDLEAFCDLCGKEFCNKYFVQAHKHSAHGLAAREKSSDSSPAAPPGGNDVPIIIPLEKIKTEAGVVQQFNSSPSLPQALSSSSSNAHHHHHQLHHHQHHHQQHHQSLHQHHQQQMQASLQALERSQSASSVTGRNFCEICNKELCNKYFMKTHMLKMHGINVDEKSFVNGATIGGVTCDICQKELCSKYFLKVHKQNTHGIQEELPLMNKENYGVIGGGGHGGVSSIVGHQTDNANKDFPLGYHPGEVDNNVGAGGAGGGNRYFSHYTEVCPLCERRFKSIKWLKTHIVNDHADLAKESGFGDLFGELLFGSATGIASASAEAAAAHHLHGQMRGHFLLSPGELTHFSAGSNKGATDKMSSTSSSSTTTSPNTTSSPFPHHQQPPHHHHQHHPHHQSSQHSHHRSLHQENDVIGAGSGGGGQEVGTGAVVHELGSTGAAGSTATGMAGSVTALPPPKMAVGISSSSAGPRKPVTSGNGTRIYHCSYCTYSTRWLSNLYAHEKRHTGLSSEGEKRFSCRVCHRAYRYNHSLQRHLISHKSPGLLLKQQHQQQHQQQQSSLTSSQHYHQQHIGATNHHNRHNQHQHGGGSMSMATARQQPTSPGSGAPAGMTTSLAGHLQYLDDDEEEDEEEEENTDRERPPRPLDDAKPFKLQKLLAGNAQSSTTATQAGTGPPASKSSSVSRVKKYRCSKCGAKYRTREQCLEHIHLYHNTRNRHQHHQPQQQQQQQLQQVASDSRNDVASDASQKQPQSSPPRQQVQVHNCPRCAFSCNNREVLVGHLARHHCGVDDDENDGGDDANRPQRLRNDDDDRMDRDDDEDNDDDGHPDAGAFMIRDHHHQRGDHQQDAPCFANSRSQMPMTYAVPQTPPSAGSFIMQPFLMSQPDVIDPAAAATGDAAADSRTPPSNTFVPSLVYLPVSHKVTDSVTVSFNLTPA